MLHMIWSCRHTNQTSMNSFYLLIALCLVSAQSIQAYLPYAAYLGTYPALGYHALNEPYLGVAPYAASYGYPYGLAYYHPRTALRNTAQDFHREDGHFSDTSLISPFKKN